MSAARRLPLLLLAAPLVAAPVAAQDPTDSDRREWLEECRSGDHGDRDRERHCRLAERGMPAPQGALTIEPGDNGGVLLRAWDRDSVHVVARIQADARTRAEAERRAAAVEVVLERGTIRATGPDLDDGAEGSWSATLEVYVPRRSDVTAETRNGPIEARGVEGTLRLTTVNGPLMLREVAGDVRARTQNGPLMVTLSGRRWQGTGLDAETRNGPIQLSIPEGYSARLETGSQNGPMTGELPDGARVDAGRFSTTRMTLTLGQGGAPVRVVTRNGPVVFDTD